MIKIGDFSRISGVSVKALRHYDEIGLLKPSKVDQSTGYRYYSTEQLDRLNRIVVLRNLGLSLEEIRNFLDGQTSRDRIKYVLHVKEAEIQERLFTEKRRLGQVEEWLRQIEKEGTILLSLETHDVLDNLRNAILNYDSKGSVEWAREALDMRIDPIKAVDAMNEAIRQVGDRFSEGELWLPDLVGATSAMLAALPILEEDIKRKGANRESLGTVVIGTVMGDIHSIGKDMVTTLLIAEGFEVHNLGVNIRVEEFIEAIERYRADILAMSALLTSTAQEQRNVIEALEESGIRDRVKVMVGGGAITADFAKGIGADGYDSTAPGAVELAIKLVGGEEGKDAKRICT
jgi:methanogenic corrinoid protein MtbC1